MFAKNPSWQGKDSIPHTTATCYGDCMKMVQTSPQTLATKVLAVASLQCTSHTREFLTKSSMTVVPHPPYFSVSPIEDKTERPPF
jgi:hypothetical protein